LHHHTLPCHLASALLLLLLVPPWRRGSSNSSSSSNSTAPWRRLVHSQLVLRLCAADEGGHQVPSHLIVGQGRTRDTDQQVAAELVGGAAIQLQHPLQEERKGGEQKPRQQELGSQTVSVWKCVV
jgi:hypothetical protein